mgnify:CR=1 FL=1
MTSLLKANSNPRRQAKVEEIGAGIGLGPNAVRALRGLGLLGDILRECRGSLSESGSFRLRSGKGDDHRWVLDVRLSQ